MLSKLHRTAPKVLSLALLPKADDSTLVVSPFSVYFNISQIESDVPECFDSYARCWELRQSKIDYRETNDFFNKLQDAPILETTFIEFLCYDNTSMFQFLPSYLWPSFFQAIVLIDLISKIVNDTAPTKIQIFSVDGSINPIWKGIVQAIGEEYNILVVNSSPSISKTLSGFLKRIGIFLRTILFGRLFLLIHRCVNQLINLEFSWIEQYQMSENWWEKADSFHGKRLLFASFGRHWVAKPGDPSRRKYDEQIFPLLPALRAAGWSDFIGIDCPYSSTNRQNYKERLNDKEPGVRWRRFYSYKNRIQCQKGLREARIAFRRFWKDIQCSANFANAFRYKNVPLMPALKVQLRDCFHHILPSCAQMLLVAREILLEEQPEGLIVTYETGPFQRALIIEASRVGIPTVGLQHGMIFDNHYDYMHNRITTDPVNHPIGVVVPKVTCVWGEFWKETLTNSGHYATEAVMSTGNWRYDDIVECTLAKDLIEKRAHFAIAPEKRVILILSSSQNILHYISEALKAIAAEANYVPLIKLHPSDDSGDVRCLLQQLGYSDSVLVDDLREAITISDLVICQWSTVVSEAILLGKPVVLVNFLKLAGAEAYIESDACLYVTSQEELEIAIDKGLNDTTVRAKMNAARTEFIARYFMKLDRQASQRVAAILQELVTEHKLQR